MSIAYPKEISSKDRITCTCKLGGGFYLFLALKFERELNRVMPAEKGTRQNSLFILLKYSKAANKTQSSAFIVHFLYS